MKRVQYTLEATRDGKRVRRATLQRALRAVSLAECGNRS
jgi:hypothetical protein